VCLSGEGDGVVGLTEVLMGILFQAAYNEITMKDFTETYTNRHFLPWSIPPHPSRFFAQFVRLFSHMSQVKHHRNSDSYFLRATNVLTQCIYLQRRGPSNQYGTVAISFPSPRSAFKLWLWAQKKTTLQVADDSSRYGDDKQSEGEKGRRMFRS